MSPVALLRPAPEGKPPETPEDDVQLTLRDHLIELRNRLRWALVWVCVGFLGCYHYAERIYHFLMEPVLKALPEGKQELYYSSATGPLLLYLKVGLWAGLLVASPGILYQAWAFVSPGLYRKERRAVLPFAAIGTLFMIAGALFCYYVILPPAFEFLLESTLPDVKPMLMMEDQLGIVMTLIIAFALIFELPLVLTFLAMLGIVDSKWLSKYRRHAIVFNVFVAAVVTPTGDPFNLALMALPMMACYELGVLGAWVFGKKKEPELPESGTA
ncbi:MAG: twin-arginine translocase subunit TatC [Deltaproteobacteria bacterium]|nr:twin-arginine translocase subunit TatC [Deltaproteobacteria bacterium]